MSFLSGRVSFCRFHVTGHAPTVADTTTLEVLSEHAFRESPIGAPSEVESGWTAGDHLYDTQFTYEKNIFGFNTPGTMLLLAMRIDTNKVPSDVKQAYRQIHTQAISANNPSGFASRAQKREAADLADRQIQEELAAGRYRRSKHIPIVWDLSRQVIYCSATGTTVAEQLAVLMQRTFSVQIEPWTAGAVAGEMLEGKGHRREYEDFRPSPLTAPPAQAQANHEDAAGPQDVSIPATPWSFSSTNTRDFLGNEWLIWLWHKIETEEGMIAVPGDVATGGEYGIVIDKTLEMDCAWGVGGKQTLKGDGPTRMAEAGEALASGKWPRKAGLILADAQESVQWELTLQADRMLVSSAALPQVGDAESPRQLAEARLLLVRQLTDALDRLFGVFLVERVSGRWSTQRQAIRKWIYGRRKPRQSVAPAEPVVVQPHNV